MTEFIDAYAVLGVPPTATDDTIKTAYRRLAARHHPDRVPEAERAAATVQMQQINIAYGLLAEPGRRRQFDHVRSVRRARGTFDDAEELWLQLVRAAGHWVGRQRGPRGGWYRAGHAVGRWLRG